MLDNFFLTAKLDQARRTGSSHGALSEAEGVPMTVKLRQGPSDQVVLWTGLNSMTNHEECAKDTGRSRWRKSAHATCALTFFQRRKR